MRILEKENLERIYENYCQGKSIYEIIAGCSDETISTEKHYQQADLVNRLMKTNPNGWLDEATPESTFKDSGEFCHIISRDFNLDSVAHRLYFNLGDKEVAFANEFLDHCRDKIPHYLKFDKLYKRDDGFVIYVDDEHLAETIEIIEQIGKNHTEFRINYGMPLSCYDCGWYGYGKELKTKHFSSFNNEVAICIEEVIAQLMAEMGYDVFDRVRVGQDQFIDEPIQEKVIVSTNEYAPFLKDENTSSQFYNTFREHLENALFNKDLLLTNTTVPNCILKLNKTSHFEK